MDELAVSFSQSILETASLQTREGKRLPPGKLAGADFKDGHGFGPGSTTTMLAHRRYRTEWV